MPACKTHEAIARIINKDYNMDDILLRVGSVAPDCWRNAKEFGFEDKYLSHFWDFRKSGIANDYDEFYLKYYNEINNPFYFGYLLHLITDQYWKTYIDPKYEITINGIKGYKLRDGSFKENIKGEYFYYHDDSILQVLLANHFDLGELPINQDDLANFKCNIDELDLTGLFGENCTLDFANNFKKQKFNETSQIFDLDVVIKDLFKTCDFIKKEIKRLELMKIKYDQSIKIAIDIDDTMLSTTELQSYYENVFLNENPQYTRSDLDWGKEGCIKFWDKYRPLIAFGSPKENADKAIKWFKGKGYLTDALSARPLKNYAPLKSDLVHHLDKNGLCVDHIYLGFHSKSQFLKDHNYDILIDNDIKNVEQANYVGVSGILYGEYNPNYLGYQTNDWEEMPFLVQKIINNKIKQLQ
ncbi:MAG: hypothetical protein PHN42_03615 [Bacilli bacterium]|nr:hypothetical protein [Bacilli bacterium]